MTEILRQQIPDSLAGKRMDQALARMFPQFSRSRLKDWLLAGLVTVDGETRRPRDSVAGGEAVEVRPEIEPDTRVEAEPVAFPVVYEDEALIVVEKPAGLVVHPGAGNRAGTLQSGLLHRYPELDIVPRAGIVHRLDKDTSGLMLVARTVAAHTTLVRALAGRLIRREYRAVCRGALTAGGTIEAPIDRHPTQRIRMAVREGGRPAITHYRVVERFFAHTDVRVRLETGRTHQIRVHFAHIRHPLVGDPVYGGRLQLPAGADEALVETLRQFRRQALHAERLALDHPETGEALEFHAALPADLVALLDALRAHRERVGHG
ncbi:MAG: 23S rRNA pseudouridine(1911/1915/1917) synthase RluD [Gammaproteobacteria bacterium]